jgi:large subunit ribosomal protein L21e
MPHSYGYRAKTRHLFKRKFGERGVIRTSTYLRTYKVGEIVDVAGNGAVHKGMPHKFYHGKTGRVWNITPRAVGVVINKQVGNRIIPKKIHVRIEHVKHSSCRDDFLNRVKRNEELKKQAKETGVKVVLKRQPVGPRSTGHISGKKVETLQPLPFVQLYQ